MAYSGHLSRLMQRLQNSQLTDRPAELEAGSRAEKGDWRKQNDLVYKKGWQVI